MLAWLPGSNYDPVTMYTPTQITYAIYLDYIRENVITFDYMQRYGLLAFSYV